MYQVWNDPVTQIIYHCFRFRFAPLSQDQIYPRLQYVIDAEKINVTESGKQALYELSGGDMRRVINVLQSTSLAFDVVDDNNVYACVGQPQPQEVKKILRTLLDGSFDTAFKSLNDIRINEGIALTDVIDNILDHIVQLEVDDAIMSPLIDQMSKIQVRLAQGCSEKIQLLCFISAFSLFRKAAFKDVKDEEDEA